MPSPRTKRRSPRMQRHTKVWVAVLATLMVALIATGVGIAQTAAEQQDACQAMMRQMQERSEEATRLEARLDENLARMKSARGEERSQAMEQVIQDLVALRKLSGAPCPMMGMHGSMHSGGMGGMMEGCPMQGGPARSGDPTGR